MHKAELRLSWRDYRLLKLAYDISVALKHAGSISEELLLRIFDQFVYTNSSRAILNLRRDGLITRGAMIGHVQIYDVSRIKQRQLFGDDDIRFAPNVVQAIVGRWNEDRYNLFDSDTIDETNLDAVPDAPPTPKNSRKRKAKTSDDELLDGIDVPQIMANIIHVTNLLGQPMPSWASYSIVEIDCPEGKNPTTVRAALNRKGYLAFRTGNGPHTWYSTEAGRQLAEDDLASPSLSEKDLSRLCN